MTAAVLHELTDIDSEKRTAWCVTCQQQVPITRKSDKKIGWQCSIANRARVQAWRLADPVRATASKQASYKAHPGPKRAANNRYAAAHRQEIRDKTNALRESLRAQVIEYYGGQCNCPGCHVVHAVLLTVDHVNGDAHHRKNSRNRSTREFYRWLVKQGFPPGYQILCGSCNLAKANRDKCPLAGEDH